MLNEPDPLVNGVPKKDNPFAKKFKDLHNIMNSIILYKSSILLFYIIFLLHSYSYIIFAIAT